MEVVKLWCRSEAVIPSVQRDSANSSRIRVVATWFIAWQAAYIIAAYSVKIMTTAQSPVVTAGQSADVTAGQILPLVKTQYNCMVI